MVTDLLIGTCGGENGDGEHEEGNRMKDGDDGATMKCMDLGPCSIRPVRILAGTFFADPNNDNSRLKVELEDTRSGEIRG